VIKNNEEPKIIDDYISDKLTRRSHKHRGTGRSKSLEIKAKEDPVRKRKYSIDINRTDRATLGSKIDCFYDLLIERRNHYCLDNPNYFNVCRYKDIEDSSITLYELVDLENSFVFIKDKNNEKERYIPPGIKEQNYSKLIDEFKEGKLYINTLGIDDDDLKYSLCNSIRDDDNNESL
jgi:hypothetical protein